MSLILFRGGEKHWSDGEILEIYNAMVLGDSALAYAGNIGYVRAGPYLAAVDVDAAFNRRLLEMHDVFYEPSNTPPLEFRAGANKTFDQALLDSGYLGAIPAVLSEAHWAIFEVAPGVYLADSNLVAAEGTFGGAPARLKAVVAGSNIAIAEAAETLTINATAAPVAASLLAGEHVELTEVDGQVRIAVPNLTILRNDHEAAEARVDALEGPVMRAGRIRVDDAIHYDDDFTLHVGWDRIMAGKGYISIVNSDGLVVSQLLRADEAGERDPAVQLHVTPTRVHAKDLQVVTSLRAPTLDVPGRLLVNSFPLWDATYALHVTTDRIYAAKVETPQLETQFLMVTGTVKPFRADGSSSRDLAFSLHVGTSKVWAKALEADSLVAPELTALGARATAIEALNATQQTEIVDLKARATTLETGVSIHEVDITALQAGATALTARATAIEALNATQETEIADLVVRATTLETGVSIHYGLILALQTGAAALGTDIDALETATASLQTRATTLETTAASQGSKVGLLTARVEVLETTNTTQTTQITDLGIRATALENASVMFGGDIEALEATAASQTTQTNDLKIRATALENAVVMYGGDIETLKTDVDAAESSLGTLTTRTDGQDAALTQLTSGVGVLQTNVGGLTTRVESLENAGNDIPGKLRVDNSNVHNTNFVFHIGGNRVLFNRAESTTQIIEALGVRGLDNTNFAFNAALNDNRASNYQSQASPNRFWVKTLIVETSISAPQLTTITNNATALTTRVQTLEVNQVTPRDGDTTETQFNVLQGSQVLSFVAGPGVSIEVVNRTVVGGLQVPDYFRVSALPWAAGRVNSNQTVLASTGRHTFTVAGTFAQGLLIRFPNHPNSINYTALATPRGAASLFVSYVPNFSGECVFFFRNSSNQNVASEFSFAIF